MFCLQPNFKSHNTEVTSEDYFEIFSAIIQNLTRIIPKFLCEGANGDANFPVIIQNSRLCSASSDGLKQNKKEKGNKTQQEKSLSEFHLGNIFVF